MRGPNASISGLGEDMQVVSGSPVIESGALTPVVELALGHPIVGLGGWTVERLHSGSGDNLGVYRVAGTAAYGDAERSWSVILKVLGKPEQGWEVGDWNFWLREPCLYQSALGQELPNGLGLPRCLGVVELPEGRCWLWLEDIVEHPWGGAWPTMAGSRSAWANSMRLTWRGAGSPRSHG